MSFALAKVLYTFGGGGEDFGFYKKVEEVPFSVLET